MLKLFEIKKYFEKKSISVEDEEVTMDPVSTIDINKTQQDKIYNLFAELEEIDDVQNIYMNANLTK